MISGTDSKLESTFTKGMTRPCQEKKNIKMVSITK
jgi:hypothetical protein